MTNIFYWPFEKGRKTRANAELQRRLLAIGLDVGPDGVDGIFGTATELAIFQLQKANGWQETGTVTREVEDFLFPGNYDRRTPSMQITSNWLSTIVTSTAFKYILTAIATAIATWLGIEGDIVLAVLTQLFGLIPGIWGMYEAAKSKAVVNGNVVNIATLPTSEQAQIAKIVADAKGKSVNEVLKK